MSVSFFALVFWSQSYYIDNHWFNFGSKKREEGNESGGKVGMAADAVRWKDMGRCGTWGGGKIWGDGRWEDKGHREDMDRRGDLDRWKIWFDGKIGVDGRYEAMGAWAARAGGGERRSNVIGEGMSQGTVGW